MAASCAMIAAAKANNARATDMSGRMIVFMAGSCMAGERHRSPGSNKPRPAMDFDKRISFALVIDIIDLKPAQVK